MVTNMYFAYGETECSYLRQKDKRLCAVIDQIGHIDRAGRAAIIPDRGTRPWFGPAER